MADNFKLDLNSIINSHITWPLNKMLATKLSLVDHFTVGSFFKSLDDSDIEFLSKEVSTTNFEDSAGSELFLMMILLMMAEGLDTSDEEKFVEKFDILLMFISLENLHRKKLVELNHDIMTFNDDMDHQNLAKSTAEGLMMMLDVLTP